MLHVRAVDKEVTYSDTKGWHRPGDLLPADLMDRAILEMRAGWDIYIKFTCQNCKARQTSATPNTLHADGYTCEECGELTKPKAFGFMAEKMG